MINIYIINHGSKKTLTTCANKTCIIYQRRVKLWYSKINLGTQKEYLGFIISFHYYQYGYCSNANAGCYSRMFDKKKVL